VSLIVVRDELVEWVRWLSEIGVRELRLPPDSGNGSSGESVMAADDGTRLADAGTLKAVSGILGECRRCKLHLARKSIVFGVGNENADLMFIGEGPGADEDEQGVPFVGRAGRKLTQMIQSIGYERDDVYIANIVKCRPPGNRDPQADEVATCSPFLYAQIEVIAPKVIVTLGSPATKTLLDSRTGITRLRGRWHDFRGIPVMPTFHPAYLLRRYTVENRTLVYNDLKAARARIDEQE
jgi:DNA polymerase